MTEREKGFIQGVVTSAKLIAGRDRDDEHIGRSMVILFSLAITRDVAKQAKCHREDIVYLEPAWEKIDLLEKIHPSDA